MYSFKKKFQNFLTDFATFIKSEGDNTEDSDLMQSMYVELLFYTLITPDGYTAVFIKKTYKLEEHDSLIMEATENLLDDDVPLNYELLETCLNNLQQVFENNGLHYLYLTTDYATKLSGGASEYYDYLDYSIEKFVGIYGTRLVNQRIKKLNSLESNDREFISYCYDIFLGELGDFVPELTSNTGMSQDQLDVVNDVIDKPKSFGETLKLFISIGLGIRLPKRMKDRGKYWYFSFSPIIILKQLIGGEFIDYIKYELDSGDVVFDRIVLENPPKVGFSAIEIKIVKNMLLDFGETEIPFKFLSFPHISPSDVIEIIKSKPSAFRWVLQNPEDAVKHSSVKLNKWGRIRRVGRQYGTKFLYSGFVISLIYDILRRVFW